MPTISGSFIPSSPLSEFDSASSGGTWRLTVSDHAGGYTGTLKGWCLLVLPTFRTLLPVVMKNFSFWKLTILLGQDNQEQGLSLDDGGDVDTEVVWAGSPSLEARRTGNDQALPSPDGNDIPDFYMQFDADDSVIFANAPGTRLAIEVEYLDEGTDSFSIQYDAHSGGPFGDGRFKDTGNVMKTDSGEFRTVTFWIDDAHFANRDNGADFRIDDHGNGPEVIHRVAVHN